MPLITQKRERFRQLHQAGCFALPNAWDIGSARFLQHLGFQAIASTSAGFAFCRGRPDNAVPVEAVLTHLQELVESVDLPVNADFENGFAHDPNALGENVRRCVETGVAGISIEDSTGDKEARSMRPITRSPGSKRRDKRSTRRAAMCSWLGGPNVFWWADRTSRKWFDA